MVFRLCRNQIAPQDCGKTHISVGQSEFADYLDQAKPIMITQLLGRVTKKFRQYSTNPKMTESDILATLNLTRKEGKELLQYFSAQLLTQNLINHHGEITSRWKGVLKFLETSLEAIKNVVHDGKSLIAAVLLAELALSSTLFLFACAHYEKSRSRESGWRSRLGTCIRQIWVWTKPRELNTSIDEILNDSMLDDDTEMYNSMLKEQLLRIRDALDAIDTTIADKAVLVSSATKFVFVAVSSVLRCDTGNARELKSLGWDMVKFGARLYKSQDRRSFVQTLSVLDAQKVRRKLQGVPFGPTAITEEGAFKREVLRIQCDVLRNGLAETHWEILVAWVDFLAVLISPDWSVSTTRLSPRLVAWIIRGDVSASQPDSSEMVPGRLIGLQQLAALGDSSWQRNFSAAVLQSAGTTQHHAEADVLDRSWARTWDELLTEDKNPLEALMTTACSSSSHGYRDTATLNPTAWLHFLVLDQLQNARLSEKTQHGSTEVKPVDNTIEIGMQRVASSCLERAADSLAVMQDSVEQGFQIEIKRRQNEACCAEHPLNAMPASPTSGAESILPLVEQESSGNQDSTSRVDDIIKNFSEKIEKNISSSPERVLWATRLSALRTAADHSRVVPPDGEPDQLARERRWLLSEFKRYANDDLTQRAQEIMDVFQPFWATVERGMLAAQRAENAVGLCSELLFRFRPDSKPLNCEWGEQVKKKLNAKVKHVVKSIQNCAGSDSSNDSDCMGTVQDVVCWMCLHHAAFTSVEGDENDTKQLIIALGNAIVSEQAGSEGCRPVDRLESWKTVETWMKERSRELGSRKFPTFVHSGKPVGGILNWVWLSCRYARLFLRTWAWLWQDCCKFCIQDSVDSHQRVRRLHMLSPLGKRFWEAAAKVHNEMTAVRELSGQELEKGTTESSAQLSEQTTGDCTCCLPATCCSSCDAGPASARRDGLAAQPHLDKDTLHKEVRHLLLSLKSAFSKLEDRLWQDLRTDMEFAQKVAEQCKDEAKDALQETKTLLSGQLDEEINDIEDFLKADDAMNDVVQFAKSRADFLEDDLSDVSEAGAAAAELLRGGCSSKRQWWRVRFKVALYVAVHCDRLETGGAHAHYDEGGAAMLWLMDLRCRLERDPRVRGILDNTGVVKNFRQGSAMTKAAKKARPAEDANDHIRNRWFIESQNRFNITLHRLLRRQFKQLEEMWKMHDNNRDAFPCLAIAVSRKAKFMTVLADRFGDHDADLRNQLMTIIESLRRAPAKHDNGDRSYTVLLEKVQMMHSDLLTKAGSLQETSDKHTKQQAATAADLKSIQEKLANVLTVKDAAPLIRAVQEQIEKIPADLAQAVRPEEVREGLKKATQAICEFSKRLDSAIHSSGLDTIKGDLAAICSKLDHETVVPRDQEILNHIQGMQTELVDKLSRAADSDTLTRTRWSSIEDQLSALPKTEDLTRLSQAHETQLQELRSVLLSTAAPTPIQHVPSIESDLSQVVMQRLVESDSKHAKVAEELLESIDAKLAILSTAQDTALAPIKDLMLKMEQLRQEFARADRVDHEQIHDSDVLSDLSTRRDSSSHSEAGKSAVECVKEDHAELMAELQRWTKDMDTKLDARLSKHSSDSGISQKLEQICSKLDGVERISSKVQDVGEKVGDVTKGMHKMEQGMGDLRARQATNTVIQELQTLLGEIRDSQNRAVAEVSSSKRSVMDRMDAVFGTSDGRTVFELLEMVSGKMNSRALALDTDSLSTINVELAKIRSTMNTNMGVNKDLLQKSRAWMQLASHSPMHWAYANKRVENPVRPRTAGHHHARGQPNGALRAFEHQETRRRLSEEADERRQEARGPRPRERQGPR